MARENDVIIYTLVPHTTHEMQPLDVAVFGPLKRTWQEVCHNYVQSHPGRIITKYQFNEIFSKAWLKSLVPANVISGFKTCSVYPFDLKAVWTMILVTRHVDLTTPSILVQRDDGNGDNIAQKAAAFTEEEETLFARQFSEGYDLAPDPRYLQWLQLNHPEGSDRNLSDNFFVSNSEHNNTNDTQNLSHCVISCRPTDVTPGLTSTHISTQSILPLVDAVSLPQQSTLTSKSIAGISPQDSATVVSNSQPKSSGIPSTSAISKYLVQYLAPPPAKKYIANTRVTGSWVLTSAEGYEILRGKEKEREGRERKKKQE